MNNEDIIINVKGIHKQFKQHLVLNGLDFKIPAGQIYAICGKNGSGKSVFLRILTGLMFPSSGKVTIFNQSIGVDVEFPSSTGALIDHPGFLLNESGKRNLQLLAKISGNVTPEKIDETMRFVGLDPDDRKPFKTYSVGMRQRLGLAQAIMEDPDLLILDEPTAGLDFDGQREIYEYLIELRNQGKTILITSHSQGEITLLCDKAFLMKDGKLDLLTDIQPENFKVEPDDSRV